MSKKTNSTTLKWLHIARDMFSKSLACKNAIESQKLRNNAARMYHNALDTIEIIEYLLIDSKPKIPKSLVLESFFNLGNIYKMNAELNVKKKIEEIRKNKNNRNSDVITLSNEEMTTFNNAINAYKQMLRISFDDNLAISQIVSVLTHIALFYQHDLETCVKYLQECLRYLPDDETVHYNLGNIFHKLNKPEMSLIHYKLSISLCEKKCLVDNGKTNKERKQLLLNNLNGISGIYRSIKYWPEALHYLLKAESIEPTDPDIQNQLGVVYTEMRRTDLAEKAYQKGIQNYKQAFISTDTDFLLSELYLNYGHMHSYNGDNLQAVENYNKAIIICPRFNLPFQNKIMNMTYLFDQLDDKMYITRQHQMVNKLYKKGTGRYNFPPSFFSTAKINIGIVSGDFVDHPVSFFIRTFLEQYNTDKFNVTCYSECLIDTNLFNKNITFKFIKNMSAETAADLIYKDKIHILFDLAGHTAFNRLDVFALKPSPIQISYIGYPFTTGLDEMDYRITDNICDNHDVSQKMYTEKLLYLPGCFVNYDPTIVRRNNKGDIIKLDYPTLDQQPFIANNFITIGCFNRLNKITDNVVSLFNKIMINNENVRFMFKTKALLNKYVTQKFLSKFDKTVRNRIEILDCTLTHEEHLCTYNKVDIAIDTFPYSGTTTSCEALFMGVPVFTLYDQTYYFHPQNVTASILKNSSSDLDFYVCSNQDELLEKINLISSKDSSFWKDLKPNTRRNFLNGDVCNKTAYIKKMEHLLKNLVESQK